jgi:predicted glutamine amidotransferase
MCELFGISSRHPTGVHVSLSEFARRGGGTGPHADGWGIAFMQDGDAQLIRESQPSASSAHLRFIHDSHAPSPLVIAHIRKATQGGVCLRNTQPFVRELGGHAHIFAHNGDLGPLRSELDLASSRFRSIGETDSEHAFCYLLSLLEPLWRAGAEEPPPLEQRLEIFGDFVDAMTEFGAANFLYCDGDSLFVHAHHRRQDDGTLCAPGLHLLVRSDDDQEIAMLASRPLCNDSWQPLAEHTVLAIRHGRIVQREQRLPRLSAAS